MFSLIVGKASAGLPVETELASPSDLLSAFEGYMKRHLSVLACCFVVWTFCLVEGGVNRLGVDTLLSRS